ncbi:transketolase C-terminal domain-containing protein [Streptomyces sp. NPDC048636]|uniref:transketolase C-terminal domain-containing protein n=1 Tax=Streptomyces sp. NPDC048636 TaxID=3155762 RepID=UPI0034439A62
MSAGRSVPDTPALAGVWEGLRAAMADDPSVVAVRPAARPPDATTSTALRELAEAVGARRVRDLPGPAGTVAGVCAAAAAAGLRPVVDLTGCAAATVLGPLAHTAAVSAATSALPVVFVVDDWGEPPGAQPVHSLLVPLTGLTTVLPSDGHDAAGLTLAAIRSSGPVVVARSAAADHLPSRAGPAAEVPLGVAAVRRPGTDVSVVAVGALVPVALRAAARLADEGVSVEVVDPRTVVPLDLDTVLGSAVRTGRLVVCDDAPAQGSVAGEIVAAATVVHSALKAPPLRITRGDPLGGDGEGDDTVTEWDIRAAIRLVLHAD